MVLGDRVSKRKVNQFRAAGHQRGFIDISGRRRARSEAGADDHDNKLVQPLVRARKTPAVLSETTQTMQHQTEAGTEAVRTTSIDDSGSSHQPEAEPTTPLEDAWMRRTPVRTPDPRVRLVGHLRRKLGSTAASSAADRERSTKGTPR